MSDSSPTSSSEAANIANSTSESLNKPSSAATTQSGSSWRDKLRKPKPAGKVQAKETWHDATLSDKERWKSWQKAKDKERAQG